MATARQATCQTRAARPSLPRISYGPLESLRGSTGCRSIRHSSRSNFRRPIHGIACGRGDGDRHAPRADRGVRRRSGRFGISVRRLRQVGRRCAGARGDPRCGGRRSAALLRGGARGAANRRARSVRRDLRAAGVARRASRRPPPTTMRRRRRAREPFGFRWFVPELVRHRVVWRDVLLASLVLQLVGLATPVFTQVIIDKVVVHRTESTLAVVGIALVLFLVFSAAMTWARQYLVLHTGNRIDAVLGARVFKHLFALPTPYFESRPTGTLTARLQGIESIREFLTGAAMAVLLDLPVRARLPRGDVLVQLAAQPHRARADRADRRGGRGRHAGAARAAQPAVPRRRAQPGIPHRVHRRRRDREVAADGAAARAPLRRPAGALPRRQASRPARRPTATTPSSSRSSRR